MNCYIQNIQSFYQNKIEILEKKLYNNKVKIKTKEESHKSENTSTKCRYWNSGYCRSKSDCTFNHPKEKCENNKCTEKRCPKRHIKDCTNFVKNTCKFAKACEYKHNPNKRRENLESQISQSETNSTKDDINDDENSLNEILNKFGGNQNSSSITEEQFEEILEEIESNHIESVEIKENETKTKVSFSCDKCDFTAINGKKLKTHVKSDHKEIYSCDKCDYNAKNKSNLKIHVKSCQPNVELQMKTNKRKRVDDNFLNGNEIK